ncbi:MAG: DNA polymerase/3'-5' exonuclease PolX [Candidatus Omnitrophica bacterium]|nr:DNA polymerase/3'-5' exonuclease PolX [Candidatus Omnitrophota bacterium]MDD5352487.1 DNA polymerase/3'-5' exonuclease PolX [Candidatus Omnitrophota bacterium]MDD5550085.1 DNA polymerase/3'-5' exonuclease PolX [Candidatus Omnitrophota bacterium]
MKNLEISRIFHSIAQILEIKGENIFRIRAYERAALALEGIDNIEDYANEDKLTDIPGIGQDLAAKIKEYLSSGKISYFEDLKEEIPEGILELLKVPSIGPKTAKLLYEKLKIKNISMLEKFAKEGKLLGLEGVKEKTVENILKGIAIVKRGSERLDIASACEIADRFIKELNSLKEVKRIEVAGSLRRMKETVKDIDILAISGKPQKVMDAFCGCGEVKEITAKGITKSSVLSKDGTQVDLRVVKADSFGAALMYFTGSKSHNIKLRTLAVRKGWKINEYGVFSVKTKKCLASKTEEEIYDLLGMRYIEPELREDTGEIEAALKNKLPKLIQLNDIKGDLHVHSNYSDGKNTIAEIAQACKSKGYEYVAVSDHSEALKVAGGLSLSDLKRKKNEIDKLNKKMKNFVIFYGSEIEIDSSGNLDYNNAILQEFDFVIAAIHSGFKQSKEQLTRRIVKACRNPNVDIIAHPTGRLWGTRDSYELDFEEVFKAAKDTNTALEINGFPNRLDLADTLIRAAKEKGVKFAIDTDSHMTEHLDYMKFGVAMARRGWLQKEDVVNTLSLKQILKFKK